jgi:hypothetical protein
MWSRFEAVACVEVRDVREFCRRVEMALPGATFPNPFGGKKRIGHRVIYYPPSDAGNPRWALPDYIALSKQATFSWQHEFRLVFSLSGALDFEAVNLSISPHPAPDRRERASSPTHAINVDDFGDLCHLHVESPPA